MLKCMTAVDVVKDWGDELYSFSLVNLFSLL